MDQRPRLPSAPLSKSNLSWYNRRILEGSTTQFGPDQKDGFTVYLTDDAVIDLHIGTFQQIPSEAFGLLMGRVYTDDIGCFTVVERVFYARNLDASPGHVQLSPEAIHDLRLQATYRHPAMDFVGWTHSHDRVSKYSDTDYQEQQTWDDPNHIGILTFMDGVRGIGSRWAIMYRGPSAQLLQFKLDATPTLRQNNKLPPFTREKPKAQESVMSQEALRAQQLVTTQPKLRPQETAMPQETNTIQPKLRPQEPVSATKAQPGKGLRRLLAWRVSIKAFFSAILMLAIVIIGVVLGNFLMLEWQPVVPTSSSANLLWDCNQQHGKAPLSVTCTGPVGPNIQGWAWTFGDGTTMEKSTVTHVYQGAGTYTITLIVISATSQHTGTYDLNAGSLTINVSP